jgi:hypothetical protein
MRERTIATSVIWIALAVSINLILNSLRYTEMVVSPIDPKVLMPQTQFVSGSWQIGAGILIFMLAGCAIGATLAIWESAKTSKAEQAAQQAEKAKRDNRDVRLKRLLSTMGDDQLDALEREQMDDEADRLSLEALLRKRN